MPDTDIVSPSLTDVGVTVRFLQFTTGATFLTTTGIKHPGSSVIYSIANEG